MVDNLCSALRAMSANLMRVTRGAGDAGALIAQARTVVAEYEALNAAAGLTGGPDGTYVGTGPVHAIKTALNIKTEKLALGPDERRYQRHVESIVSASLRIAAARQLGDSTQERAGEHDLHAVAPFKPSD